MADGQPETEQTQQGMPHQGCWCLLSLIPFFLTMSRMTGVVKKNIYSFKPVQQNHECFCCYPYKKSNLYTRTSHLKVSCGNQFCLVIERQCFCYYQMFCLLILSEIFTIEAFTLTTDICATSLPQLFTNYITYDIVKKSGSGLLKTFLI